MCRELTKTYEEVRRGSLAELVDWAGAGVRGEVTIVVQGASPVAVTVDDLAALVEEVSASEDVSRKEAIVLVARRVGLPKREVYDAVHRKENP